MKKIAILTFVTILSLYSEAQKPSDAYIQSIMSAGKIPGAEAVIIKDGHWIYDKGWGLADISNNKTVNRQTLFMIASISKTMIATSLMQLWEKGAFKLDDDINAYLPFKVQNPYHPTDTITFRMLVSHTSSIQDNYTVMNATYVFGDSPIPLDSLLRNYFVPGGVYYTASKNFYTYHAGKGYNYSNMAATLAAYLVQRISGDDYAHYCDTAIFAKLCMDNASLKLAGIKDTTLIARPYSWSGTQYLDNGLYGYADYPDGQLRTHITALARFMTTYMQYGIYEGRRMLDSSTVALMTHNISTGPRSFPGTAGQGVFFYTYLINKDTLWGHNGGDAGVSTAMYFSYKTQTGVIVLTNGDANSLSYNMETILDTLYKYGLTVTPAATDTFPSCNSHLGISSVIPADHFDISVFPNPAGDLLNVEISDHYNQTFMEIYNMNGKKFYSKEIIGNSGQVITSDFPPGLYILTFNCNGMALQHKKLLITH